MRLEEPLSKLTNGEFVGFAAVVGSILVVFGATAVVLGRMAVARIRGSMVKTQAWEWIILATAVLGLCCIAYGYFVEPYQLEVTHVTLHSEKLAGVSRPLRIVQLSDLHCEKQPHQEEQIPLVVAAQKPDIIVFTGDSINTVEALPVFRRCMTRLAQIAPTYAVYGNHDSRDRHNVTFFNGTGVKALNGKGAILDFEGRKIWVSGVGIDSEWLLPKLFKSMPKDAYSVFLYHFPAGVEPASENGVDLCLTGHTHGGQVRLPFYGAVITRSKLGKQYESGLYRVGNTDMYVNRGIGMEGGFSPRVRFLCLPEITVLDVK
jgi:predicted MPP superfamily phosphohydrolase